MGEDKKICRICHIEKPLDGFHFRKDSGKHRNECKECVRRISSGNRRKRIDHYKATQKEYRTKNADKISQKHKQYQKENFDTLKTKRNQWREQNRERIKQQRARFYQENKERINEEKKKLYRQNKEHHRNRQNKYDEANKERLRAARRKWENERLKNDPTYRLAKNLRGRVKAALKRTGNGGRRTTDLIGCTVDEARAYLESQFKEGMTWENYGTVWNIDHKIPISWFNLENEHCLKAAFNYKNMQPLYCMENFLKNNKRHDPIIHV